MTSPLHPEMLSSVKGRVTSILLVYPGVATEAGDLEYQEIVALFKDKGHVYRFRQEVPDFTLKLSNFRGRSKEDDRFRDIYNLSPGMDIVTVLKSWRAEMKSVKRTEIITFRRWAQDPFCVLAMGEFTILLYSLHSQRMCDFFLPQEIAQQVGTGFLLRPTRLCIEGGNILRGERYVFLGKDLVMDNADKLGLTEEEVLHELGQSLGVSSPYLYPVGFADAKLCLKADGGEKEETWQPLFHIDMFMVPAGIDAESGREVIFLANSKLCVELLEASGDPKVVKSGVEGRAHEMFAEVRAQFASDDFKVEDLPVFFHANTTFSWNNCIVEISGEEKRVYLPSYQCAHDPEKLSASFLCLETAVESAFRNRGFEVVWIRQGRLFRTLARHGGSLHCIVKVMSRSLF